MTLLDRIKELADEKHISIAELERACDISNGQIRHWNTRSPRTETLQKVADYFDVSIDYLLGRTDKRRYYDLTERDERDVQKVLKNTLEGLTNEGSLSYLKNGGEEIDEEDAQLLAASLENVIRQSKILAKKKFTPKKYRGNTDSNR